MEAESCRKVVKVVKILGIYFTGPSFPPMTLRILISADGNVSVKKDKMTIIMAFKTFEFAFDFASCFPSEPAVAA